MEMNSHSRFYAAPLRLHTYLCQPAFYDGGRKRCHTLITPDDDSILAAASGGFGCGVLPPPSAATLVCSGAALKRRRRLFAARVHVCGRVSCLIYIHVRNTIAELD